MIKVSIVGVTGFTGCELLKLLLLHSKVEIVSLVSRSNAGKAINTIFPALGSFNQVCEVFEVERLAQSDVVFFATPHGVCAKYAMTLLDKGLKVIDLSADFRLKDPRLFEEWYGQQHPAPELLASAVYGLTELNREAIRSAQLLANPGCYPTASQLGLAPILQEDLLADPSIVIDAKSGVSGAGRTPDERWLFTECDSNFAAYGLLGHRHQPEILQGVSTMNPSDFSLTFVPHLVPMVRGIEASIYVRLQQIEPSEIQAIFERFYHQENFVAVCPYGQAPGTKSVSGTNRCRIAIAKPKGSPFWVISSVIDNLLKGAVGQAIQNMNLMFGIEELEGLQLSANYP